MLLSYFSLVCVCVSRNLNVSWDLTLCDCWGQDSTLELSRAYYFESSVVVRWSGGDVISYRHISSIQLHGVRKEMVRGSKARRSDTFPPPPLHTHPLLLVHIYPASTCPPSAPPSGLTGGL